MTPGRPADGTRGGRSEAPPAAGGWPAGATDPGRVVLRFPNWIGDVFMALPTLEIARQLWPAARLAVQVRPHGRPILEGLPGISELLPVPARGGPGWASVLPFLRSGRYRLGVLLTPSFSSALLFFLGGVGERVGWRGEMRDALLTRPVEKPARTSSLVGHYQALFRELGYRGPGLRPRYTPPHADQETARSWLRERGLENAAPVALAPAALHGPSKRWPTARYRELASKVAGGRGWPLVVIGSRADGDLLRQVAGGVGNCHVMAGDLGLRAVAGVLGQCRALVGNDTGLLHMARATGTPVVGIYGSTTPDWSGPAPEEGDALYRRLPCSPCFRRECPLKEDRLACLEGIAVEQVEDALCRVLSRRPGGSS